MDNLQATSAGAEDGNNGLASHNNEEDSVTNPALITAPADIAAPVVATTPDDVDAAVPSASADGIATVTPTTTATPDTETEPLTEAKGEQDEKETGSDEISDDETSGIALKTGSQQDEKEIGGSPKFTKVSEDEDDFEDQEPRPKKQKPLSSLTPTSKLDLLAEEALTPSTAQPRVKRMSTATATATAAATATPSTAKKSKKKSNSVWTKPTSRKGKKKPKNNNSNTPTEDTVMITPIARFPDKSDDSPESEICLSKVYKAEKVELSDDRLSAGSTKGYRMVRATRGVVEGAWYFEIKVEKLGETGHTRLGWSTEKGDLQAPVGYDANSFGYRDIDGSKIHKALREKYGDEGYTEGDVIGFYISLPDGEAYAPKPPHLVWYKGQRYACAPDGKEDPPKVVPGSQISFFKNGVCQGVAFQDLYGGRYYPAASMYTLPNQPNCVVKFNFGPDFEFFPEDFDGRPSPRPMIEVPYHGYDGKLENGVPRVSIRRCPTLKVVDEQDINLVEASDL